MEGKLIQGTSQAPSPSQTQNPQNDETSNGSDFGDLLFFAFMILMVALFWAFINELVDVLVDRLSRKKEE